MPTPSDNADITDRLRRWAIATDAVPASDLMDEAAAEIELLRGYRNEAEAEASIASLAAQRLRLTDAEREAVELAIDSMSGVEDISASWSQRETAAIATLRGLLDRLFPIKTTESDRPQAIATPHPQSTPAECTVPSEWTSRPYWVDPPSGHRYGFPRLYDPASDGDMTEWMIANGYPERLARQGLACTFTAATEDGGT